MSLSDEQRTELMSRKQLSSYEVHLSTLIVNGVPEKSAEIQAKLKYFPDVNAVMSGAAPVIELPDVPVVKRRVAKPKKKVTFANFDVNTLPSGSKPTVMIRWVAANLEGTPDMSTCPGRDAYSLLAACLGDASFTKDFWKSIYPRTIPSRAALSNTEVVVEMDGQKIVNVLDKIGSISISAQNRGDE